MSTVLVKTAKGKKTFTDSHGKKRIVASAEPFKTDAATAERLIEAGGFKLAREPQVHSAPVAVDDQAGASSGDAASGAADPGAEDASAASVAEPDPELAETPEPVEE